MVLTRGARNKSDDGAGNADVAVAGADIVAPILNIPRELKTLNDSAGSGGRRRLKTNISTTPFESPAPQNFDAEFTLCREISPVNTLKVGCRIEFFWPIDNVYYQGIVKIYLGKHLIFYTMITSRKS